MGQRVAERGHGQCWGEAEHRLGVLGGRGGVRPSGTIALGLGGGDKGVGSKWERAAGGRAGDGSSAAGAGGAQTPFCVWEWGVWGVAGGRNGAGGCWTPWKALLTFHSKTQAWLPMSGGGEVAGTAVLSGLSCAASLRAEGFSLLLGFPKRADCTKAPLQRRCACWADIAPWVSLSV